MGFFLPSERPAMPDPAAVAAKLFRMEEFRHIGEAEARVEFLMRSHPEVKAGRAVLGTVFVPDVTGRLRDVFQWLLEDKFGGGDQPAVDFLIMIDADYWLDSDDRVREILIYHELCHIQPAFDKFGSQRFDRATGLPVLCLVGHDVEEFSAVVRKYGGYSQDIRNFVAAVSEGDAKPS